MFVLKEGICYYNLDKKNQNNYEILFQNTKDEFDLIIDQNDCVHIACQDNEGSIIYLTEVGNEWKKFVVLKSKTQNVYNKYFNIKKISDFINLFYVVNHNSKNMLVHQILDNLGNAPSVIDYVLGKNGNYCLNISSEFNILLFYISDNEKNLCFNIYKWAYKKWESVVFLNEKNVDSVASFIDDDDSIHLIFEKENELFYKKYAKTGFNSFEFSETVKINQSKKNKLPIIFKNNNELWIMWENNQGIFGVSSKDGGNSFSAQTRFMATGNSQIKIYDLISLNKNIKCFGYFDRQKLNLILLNDFLKHSQNNDALKPKIMEQGYDVLNFSGQLNKETNFQQSESLANEITKLKIMLDSLSQKFSVLENKVFAISSKIYELENEAQRNNAFVEIENDIKLIKEQIANLWQGKDKTTFAEVFKKL